MTENKQYTRQVARRIFSDALNEVDMVERDPEDEYAPQFVRLSTGELVSRIFLVGALTDCQDIGTDTPFFKLRVSDPHGIFNCTAGQYSPIQVQNMLDEIEVPCFVSITGKLKPREYNEKIYCDVSIESINVVDSGTYDHWVAETEQQTEARRDSNV